jgi:ribosomal protein S18 acetylase RimI-like enzyme
MHVEQQLKEVVEDFVRRKDAGPVHRLEISAPDCWRMSIRLDLGERESLEVANLRDGDLPALHQFAMLLGERGKDLFCPYPWTDSRALDPAFLSAIRQSVARVDASFLLRRGGDAIGHFFLWKAGGNPHSLAHGLQVPELGVAIAEPFQRRGMGGLCVRILQAAARSLGADGIELTTAMTNDSGWSTYRGAGFEYVGQIRTPLDVDVTAALAGQVTASRFREERQMLYVIRPDTREALLRYLQLKREAAGR